MSRKQLDKEVQFVQRTAGRDDEALAGAAVSVPPGGGGGVPSDCTFKDGLVREFLSRTKPFLEYSTPDHVGLISYHVQQQAVVHAAVAPRARWRVLRVAKDEWGLLGHHRLRPDRQHLQPSCGDSGPNSLARDVLLLRVGQGRRPLGCDHRQVGESSHLGRKHPKKSMARHK